MKKSLLLKIAGYVLSLGGTIILGISSSLDNESKLKQFVDEHLNK